MSPHNLPVLVTHCFIIVNLPLLEEQIGLARVNMEWRLCLRFRQADVIDSLWAMADAAAELLVAAIFLTEIIKIDWRFS